MKYKLLIVEDEKVERESTLLTIQLHCHDRITVETAGNGIEALQMFENNVPDIVIMDIDLPGYSGIETIAQMQTLSKQPQFIILSAHKMFAYAQAALKLGVLEYLLKPCCAKDLLSAVETAIDRVESAKNKKQAPDEDNRWLSEITPVLESDCVFTIASMRANTHLEELFQFLQIETREGFVFVIKSAAAQRKLLSTVKKGLHRIGVRCIGEAINGLCVFVVLGDITKGKGKRLYIADFLVHILDELQIVSHIGMGRKSTNIEQLIKSYGEALKALTEAEIKNKPYVIFSQDVSEEKLEEISVKETAQTLIWFIKAQDHKGIDQVLTELFAQWTLKNCKRNQMDNAVYRIWLKVVGAFPDVVPDELLEEITLQKIHYYPDISALCQKIIDSLIEISVLCTAQERCNCQNSDLIHRAINIIHEQYAQNISLNQVATELCVTPFYLSKLVKKQTGKTFTDYLTLCRIHRAKDLLDENRLSIKEITYAVGFNSQNYFAKVFKKHTQLSPSDYRIHHKTGSRPKEQTILR